MPVEDEVLIESLQATDPEAVVAQYGPFVFTKSGMIPTGTPQYDEWAAAMSWSQRVASASPFWVADMITFGESHYGEKYAQALDATEHAYGTLANAVYVAKAIPADRRRPQLSFAIHQEVAPLPPAEQEQWLDRVETEGWTREQLRTQMRAEKAQQTGQAVAIWLLVRCTDVADQDQLAARLRAEGRAVKVHVTKE
jgi:hypothetical protein